MGMSIKWHGVSSDNWNVVVEKYPNRIIPAAKYTQYEIPGRSGDYLYFNAHFGGERNYANYVQRYEVYLSAETDGLEHVAKEVARWLYARPTSPGISSDGYFQLEDSYDQDLTYRWAQFVGPVDVESSLARFGRCTIEFLCKPKRFYKSGNTPITLSTGVNTLTNPTYDAGLNFGFRAKPLLTFINLNGKITISDGNNIWVLDGTPSGKYNMFCDEMDITGPNGDAFNNLYFINSYDFPSVLNTIEFTLATGASVGQIEIYPRWWTL